MDQPNPNTPPHDPNDLSFNVMPQEGKTFSGYSSAPAASKNSPPPPPNGGLPSGNPSSRKWIYIIVGLIVLLALGAVAYYMVGGKKTDTQPAQTVSKLPKVWLQQYFTQNLDSNGNCNDQIICGDNADPDRDGLTNYEEFKAGTNPLNPDTDGDGLADGDEVNIYKTDPTLKYTDRREVVAQNNWTDGFQIKNGYDPLTPGRKFTETRKQQIADDTAKFKLHEPSITTTTSAVTPPAAQTANWKTYTNKQYGFEIKLPSSWTNELSTQKGKTVYIFEDGKPNFSGLTIAVPLGSNFKPKTKSEAKQINFSGANTTFYQDSFYQKSPGGDLLYSFQDTYVIQKADINNIGITTSYPEGSKILMDQILSTFKFTK